MIVSNSEATGADKHKRFEKEGVVFKAKLIGSELVMEPRGDKMCQNSIQRLKAIIKGTNSHKRRVVLKISYDGVKVYDEKTNEILHHHEVSQISYIASDDTDSRTFGYVSDVPNKAHQFICFKTTGPAISVMSVISALFEAVLEKKNQAEKEKQGTGGDSNNTIGNNKYLTEDTDQFQQDSVDLVGDSGIAEGNSSILIGGDKEQQSGFLAQSSLIFDDNIESSPGNSFSSTSKANNNGASSKKLANSADLLFDDLFAGLSDPIIVDKNDSLISYKPDNSSQLGSTVGPFNVSVQQQELSTNMAHPIPRRQPPPMLPPPSSLPRPAPMMTNSSGIPNRNRSLVYNHSSVSLSDAALTRNQSSFASSPLSNTNNNDSYVDRYAVFNDIDNLPSIFESTSLGSNSHVNSTNNIFEPLNTSGVSGGGVAGEGMTSNLLDHFSGPAHMSADMSQPTMTTILPLQKPLSIKQVPASMGNSSMLLNSALNSSMNSALNRSVNPNPPTISNNNHQRPSSYSQSFNQSYLQQSSSSASGVQSNLTSSAAGNRSTSSTDANMFRQTNPFDDDFFA